MEFEP
jgi:hypothetical protein